MLKLTEDIVANFPWAHEKNPSCLVNKYIIVRDLATSTPEYADFHGRVYLQSELSRVRALRRRSVGWALTNRTIYMLASQCIYTINNIGLLELSYYPRWQLLDDGYQSSDLASIEHGYVCMYQVKKLRRLRNQITNHVLLGQPSLYRNCFACF